MATPIVDEPATDRSALHVEVVREVTAALQAGDLLAVMGKVSSDVRWAVSAADRGVAPWFRIYQGKQELPALFAALSQVSFGDFTLKRIMADDDVVITWLHVAFTAPTGRSVDMDEVQIWELDDDGKISSVTTVLDTAAVAAAFR